MEYKTKLLIADESPVWRAQVREGLMRAGYRNIEEAVNGEEAVIKMSQTHPEVVLLDVWLSKLDGIGVLRNAQTMDWGSDKAPAFIVVSSVSNQNIFIQRKMAYLI
jgi:DNA-binding NarL/FixJ family response regulator